MAKRPKIQKMSLSEKQELYDDYIRFRAERVAMLVREMYAVRFYEEALLAEDIRMAGVLCATCGAESSRAEPVIECHIQGPFSKARFAEDMCMAGVVCTIGGAD